MVNGVTMRWLVILIYVVDCSVSLQWYNSGPQNLRIGLPAVMQWRYKLTASEQQMAKDFSMLLWERETSLDSNEWITVAALQPNSGKKVGTDSNIELRNNLTLYINRMESVYFSRFRCSFISSFASSFSDLVVKKEEPSKRIRVRLVGGSSPNQGRVELYYQGAWGTICDNGWDAIDATVICSMLGYPRGIPYCCASYGQGKNTIWLDNVNCQGNETSILDCNISKFGMNNCTHASDAGVYCYGPTPPRTGPTASTVSMTTAPTVSMTTAPVFKVRLVNGSYQNQGRVEVLYGGTWGTVCHNQWDSRNAKVVCNMLGYPLGYPYCCSHYGRGSGPIWMDKVYCDGKETSLSMCRHAGWQNNSCDHSMDAGVYCYFPLPPGISTDTSTTQTTTAAPTTVTTPPVTCPPQPNVSVTTGINCTFDGGFCGWTTVEPFQEGMFKWTRFAGSTPTENTGPDGDHTSGCGSYVYLEATAQNKSNSAILASPMLSAKSAFSCFSFYYHMNGSGMGRMAVALRRNIIWSVSGHQGDQWNLVSININVTSSSQIFIFGAIGSNDKSDIAIDDISYTPGSACSNGVVSNTTTAPPVLSGKCSFDSGWCGWTNIQGDQFDWLRHSKGTPTLGTGPSTDHTSGSGWYVYIETSLPRKGGEVARLVSPVLKAGNSCMSFYYHMFDDEKDNGKTFLGQLRVKIGSRSIWQTIGNHGNKWYQGMVSLSSKDPFQVTLEGVCGSNAWSDIAVDDIDFLHDTECLLEANCTFEEGYCGWSNDDADKLDWGRNYGSTLSENTGPSADHTTQADNGYYIFIETSQRITWDNARLVSPALAPTTKCMTFYYHMFGETVGTLSVQAGGVSLWTLSGNQGNSWYKATVPLDFSQFFKVTIEGNVGTSFTGDIAVDDITFTSHQCQLTAASQIPAKVIHISMSQTVKEGEKLHLTCTIKGSIPTYVAWFKDGIVLQNDSVKQNYTVSKVRVEDAGEYACLASNDYGRDQKKTSVNVQYGPKNTALYTDVPHNVAEPGKSVVITCLTDGNPRPSCLLMMQKPDNSIHQLSNSLPGVYDISSYNSHQHDGVYLCQCSNPISSQNKFLVLSTYVSPKIDVIAPVSQSIDEKETIKMFCNATGNPAPNITWTKVEDPARKFQLGSALVITDASKTDAGTYKCTADNGRGFAIGYANVSMNRTFPQIIIGPQNITVYEFSHSTVTFTCNATGTPEPSLIWKKRGTDSILSRASQLVVSNITRSDHGIYSCIANNGFGGNVTSSALLEVLYKPSLTKLEVDNDNPVIVGNGRALLICKSDANPPANNHSFFLNGNYIEGNENGELLIFPAKQSDQGLYRCQPKNNIGSGGTAEIYLTVVEPLEIVAPPHNQSVVEGSNFTMFCNVNSSLPVKIVWEKVGKEGKLISHGNVFSMTNVSRSDAGIYRCIAKNGIALPATATALLNVLYKPTNVRVLIKSNHGVVSLNHTVLIQCKVDANPLPHDFRFYLNGSLIQSGSANVYTIMGLKTSSIGNYSCVATNSLGVGPNAFTFLNTGGKVPGNFTKCYKVNITAYYKIPGGYTFTQKGTTAIFFSMLRVLYLAIPLSPKCIGTRMTGYRVQHSPPRVQNVYVQLEVTISAKDTVPMEEVASKTSSCVNYFNALIPEMKAKLPPIITNGTIHRGYNVSISDKKSCCGNSAPPCCTTPTGAHLNFLHCDSQVNARLVGGTSANEGRVEVYHQGVWGTICDSGWDIKDALVVCRMLGFVSAEEAKCCAFHGKGTGQIWLRNVSCKGNETSLDKCLHGGWSGETCDHSQDASVVCSSNRTDDTSYPVPSPTTQAPGQNVSGAIIINPNYTAVNLGDNVSFTCNATGVPSAVFIWTKSGEDKIYVKNKTLTILNVQRNDEGRYRCQVVNGNGYRAHAIAVLNVCRPPSNTRLETNNVNPVVLGNGQITLLCTTDAYPSPRYSFYKGDKLLTTSTIGGLEITKAKYSDEGSYKCIVSNNLGQDKSDVIVLKVYGSLSIESKPINTTADEGSTASFFCNATSVLPARISWERVGQAATQLAVGEMLKLSNVARSDEGTYRCVAKNGLAYQDTAVASLTVRYKPQKTRLVAVPDDVVTVNRSVTLRCSAEANPPVSSFKFYHIHTLVQHSSSNLYHIATMTEVLNGSYSCLPTNDLGDGLNATLQIKIGVPCGVRHIIPPLKARIAGGTDADPGSHPWQAQITRKPSVHICGGSILTSRFIVSAAHCFPPRHGLNYTVTLGEHSLSKSDGHEQKREVEKIIRHENYSYTGGNVDYDIALLKLKEPITFDGLRTAPACIIESNFSAGEMCTITGWGRLSYKGTNPDILQEAKIKLLSEDSCKAVFGSDFTPRMLCAGGDGVKDACQGDSGGPLMCERNHKFYLTGLTSWGIGCALKGKPGVYTNVLELKQWIEDNISNNV